ncbi:HORMA domain [Phaffia rhodozyma]|uniref:HORMA domain n=1 Tax=Phaffia rhodozyma TaxID=264483 RepID=A0A0F7SRX3_PHARH|nr:HORMA domain [Phaffia rhodozyma]
MNTQAVKTTQSQVTGTQSTSIVRTLMMASLGCITYLRGLLPEENFNDEGVHPLARSGTSSSGSSGGSQLGGLRIKTIKKNFSPEGDKLIQWIEQGVMDAVEKGYLKAMVMSIYMDPKDPLNVIETYTFNFTYHKVTGVGTVPILSVEQKMKSMTVSTEPDPDPIFSEVQAGKPLTLGHVKKATKSLLKQLILMTQNLAELPRKRCVSVTLFYEDHTPEDYQPPMFRADNERDKMYFATHAQDEAPEVLTIDALETGHHGVSIKIRSVAEYLPASLLANDSDNYFTNTNANRIDPDRGRELDEQMLEKDKELRSYLWNAQEENNMDDDQQHLRKSVEPLEDRTVYEDESSGFDYTGADEMEEEVLDVVGKNKKGGLRMNNRRTSIRLNRLAHPELDKTQSQAAVPETQPIDTTQAIHQSYPVPNEESVDAYVFSPSKRVPLAPSMSIDEDPIQSFSSLPHTSKFLNSKKAEQAQTLTKKMSSLIDANTGEEWLPCWCLDHQEDGADLGGLVGCDKAGCKVYMHVWCTGREKKKDFTRREPFFCLNCRLHQDERCAGWSEEDYETARQQFRSLALFRRALMVTYDNGFSFDIKEVAMKLSCELAEARAVSQRLELEVTSRKKKNRKMTVSRSAESLAKLKTYFDKRDTALEDQVVGMVDKTSEEEDEEVGNRATERDISPSLTEIQESTPSKFSEQKEIEHSTVMEVLEEGLAKTQSRSQFQDYVPSSLPRSPKRKSDTVQEQEPLRKRYRVSTAMSEINLDI